MAHGREKTVNKLVDQSHTREFLGRPDGCGYCPGMLGEEHTFECVCNTRPIRFRLVVEWDDEIPASWSDERILFARNQGSWCMDNALESVVDSLQGHCMCEANGVKVEIVQ